MTSERLLAVLSMTPFTYRDFGLAGLLSHRLGAAFFVAIPPGGSVRGVAVTFVPEAEPDDEVTEQEGVTAFVASEVTAVLGKAVLDSSPVDAGEELVIHR